MPIRILQILEATAGGARKHMRYLACELRKREMDVDVIVSTIRSDADFADDIALYEEIGCTVFDVDMARVPSLRDRAALKEIKTIIAKRRPQIVHCHCFKAGLLGRAAARSVDAGIKTVYTPHAFAFDGLGAVRRAVATWFERRRGKITDLLLCISESEREQAEARGIVPRDHIVVAPNGIAAGFAAGLLQRESARAELGLDDGVIAIGVLSRLAPQKGHSILIRALAMLSDEDRKSLRVLLFGDGELEAGLKSQVAKAGLDDTIRFQGHTAVAERFLPGLDFTVLPSQYEGLSYSLLESMAAGLPVIASDTAGNRCAGSPVLYFANGNVRELASRIYALAADSAGRQRLSAAGPDFVQATYPLQNQLDTIVDAYHRLLDD
jgi:glycosyltransferase involved in cell wall biosynthesis